MKGIAISLKYQHDHAEDSVLLYNPHSCVVYLVAEEVEHEKAFVKLSFSYARAARSARTDCSPCINIYPEELGRSYISELTGSEWALEAHKKYSYSGTKYQQDMRHFVVSNHDIFHEILAESFTETLVSQEDLEFERIKNYFM